MRILFQNRPKHFWQGGDYVQMEATAEALRKLGVEVDISEEMVIKPELIDQYDLVHLWNFSMYWTKLQLWVARKHKKPVVCSMIYHESDQWIPYDLQQIMLQELSCAIFQTKGELERVKRHLNTTSLPYEIIPNALDPYWNEVSKEKIGLEDYILTVGRIEPSKGQLAVARVCKKLNIPYLCIGETKDQDYFNKLVQLGVIVYPHKIKEELKPYYYSARLYIQPSQAETWSMCVDEASSQGTPCILTTKCERRGFTRCEYDNDKDIERVIKMKWNTKKKFIKQKEWSSVAEQIKQVYDKILLNR